MLAIAVAIRPVVTIAIEVATIAIEAEVLNLFPHKNQHVKISFMIMDALF